MYGWCCLHVQGMNDQRFMRLNFRRFRFIVRQYVLENTLEDSESDFDRVKARAKKLSAADAGSY